MDTAIKHLVSDQVKLSFVIFDIGAIWAHHWVWASECPDVNNYKWRLSPGWQDTL